MNLLQKRTWFYLFISFVGILVTLAGLFPESSFTFRSQNHDSIVFGGLTLGIAGLAVWMEAKKQLMRAVVRITPREAGLVVVLLVYALAGGGWLYMQYRIAA